MEQIYSCFGITIIKQDEKYFMQYDSGEMEQMMWLISLMLLLLSVYQMMKQYGIDLERTYQMNLKYT